MTTLGCRPLCQSQEMHIPHRYCGISWFYTISRGATHGSSESLNNPIMAICKRYNSELGNSNYYTTFSVSKGVIQRKKESQSSVTSSPNDKQIDLALWLWQSKQG